MDTILQACCTVQALFDKALGPNGTVRVCNESTETERRVTAVMVGSRNMVAACLVSEFGCWLDSKTRQTFEKEIGNITGCKNIQIKGTEDFRQL